MIDTTRLEDWLDHFPQLTIGLLGDLFLDRYLEIDPAVSELSIETGLEAFQVERVRNSPGALGTVMNNLAALGVGQLIPITVIGDDGHGDDLMRELRHLPCDPSHVIRDPSRLTPTYTKPLRLEPDGTWSELNRLDMRTRAPLSTDVCAKLDAALRHAFDRCDGLIVLDQINESDWGVVNTHIRGVLDALCRRSPSKLVFVDSRTHLNQFTGGVLKANRDELLGAVNVGDAPSREADAATVARAAGNLAARTGRPVFCTLGAEGILVTRSDADSEIVPGMSVNGPIVIVGAGDSATSGIVTALLSGASEVEAAAFGNLVASITVQQLGTTGTATPSQLRSRCGACQ